MGSPGCYWINFNSIFTLDGAGGKGTWGKNGVIYDEFEEKDPNDPNYKDELVSCKSFSSVLTVGISFSKRYLNFLFPKLKRQFSP